MSFMSVILVFPGVLESAFNSCSGFLEMANIDVIFEHYLGDLRSEYVIL